MVIRIKCITWFTHIDDRKTPIKRAPNVLSSGTRAGMDLYE